jgi:3-oxoadipate enol-lactonase
VGGIAEEVQQGELSMASPRLATKTVHLNGIDINYVDEGKGDVLLMIHNLTSHIQGFCYNVPELARHFRVIAPDVRGHGGTTHEDDFEKAKPFYTFDNMVDDALALLAHLGVNGRFHLFGQAYWGANIAFNIFRRVPDRVRALVVASAHMISTDPGVPTYMLLPEKGKQNFIRMHAIAREKGMTAVFEDRKSNRQFWHRSIFENADMMADFAEAHRLTSAAAFVTIPHLSHARRAEISHLLKTRRTAAMLLLGADDSNNPQAIEELRKDYPALHIVLLEGCGHYPTIENPADFNHALLNFYAGAEKYSGV